MHIDSAQYGVIRQFEPRDTTRILEIAEESLSEYYTGTLIMELYESWPEAFKVFTVDDHISGFLIGARNSPDEARILMFAVERKLRGKGIGNTLMQDFLAFCSKDGILSVKLEVKTDNDLAINFYKRFGFIVTSRLRAYYSDASDAFSMWKII